MPRTQSHPGRERKRRQHKSEYVAAMKADLSVGLPVAIARSQERQPARGQPLQVLSMLLERRSCPICPFEQRAKNGQAIEREHQISRLLARSRVLAGGEQELQRL